MKIKGAPTVLGQNLGLVLEMNRNNNFVISASKIEKLKAIPENISLPKSNLKTIDLLTYRDLLWKSRFTTIKILKMKSSIFPINPNQTTVFSGLETERL